MFKLKNYFIINNYLVFKIKYRPNKYNIIKYKIYQTIYKYTQKNNIKLEQKMLNYLYFGQFL